MTGFGLPSADILVFKNQWCTHLAREQMKIQPQKEHPMLVSPSGECLWSMGKGTTWPKELRRTSDKSLRVTGAGEKGGPSS